VYICTMYIYREEGEGERKKKEMQMEDDCNVMDMYATDRSVKLN